MYKGKPVVKIDEVCARVTGYYRPVHAWNAGKQQEFADRKLTPAANLQ